MQDASDAQITHCIFNRQIHKDLSFDHQSFAMQCVTIVEGGGWEIKIYIDKFTQGREKKIYGFDWCVDRSTAWDLIGHKSHLSFAKK